MLKFHKATPKKRWGNIISLCLFLLLSFVYFHNAFLKGLIPAYYDIYGYFYPMMGLVKEQYLSGIIPFWNNYVFSGFPLMAASQPGVFYPISVILSLLLPQHLAFMLDITIHFALAGFFTFLYARKIGIANFAALTSGALFAFMGYILFHVEFISVLRTAVWIPLILYFFEELRIALHVKTALKASLAIALQIFAGHPQIYFFTYMIIVFFVLYHVFYIEAGMRLRFLALSSGAIIIGFIIASPQLFATYELSSLGIRTEAFYENFIKHAFPLERVPAFLFPSLYKGRTEGYMGILPVLLAIVALLVNGKDNIHIRFWGYVAIISLALSLGDAIRPLNKLMFQIPVYHSFRGFSKHLIEFDLSIALLSGFGISFILNRDKARKSLLLMIVSSLALFIIFLIVTGLRGSAMLGGRESSLFLFSISLILFMLYSAKKFQKYNLFKYLILIIIFLEIISYRQTKWTKADNIDNYYATVFTSLEGKKDRAVFFGNNIIPLLSMRHKISLIGGYDPMILNDYDLLLQLNGIGGWSDSWPGLLQNNMILSILNTKYIILPPGIIANNSSSVYKRLFDWKVGTMYENTLCMPRAYSISKLIGFNSQDPILLSLSNAVFDFTKQAAISDDDLNKIGTSNFSFGKVAIENYGDNEVDLRTDFKGEGFIVLADAYYPGWHAYIDNKSTDIYKTNGILRGIVIPSGIHTITFKYQPWKIYACMALSIFTVVVIAIILIRRHGPQGISDRSP